MSSTKKTDDEAVMLLLLLTNKCNLDCSYCYAQKDSRTMPFETAKKALHFAHALSKGEMLLTFAGGEPLLEWGLLAKVAGYAAKTFKIAQTSVFTNGLLLDEKKVDHIKRGAISLMLSLDGLPEAQDKGRKSASNGGSFELIRPKLEMLREAYKGLHLSINVRMTLLPEFAGKLTQSIAFLAELLDPENLHILVVPEIHKHRWSAGQVAALRREMRKLAAGNKGPSVKFFLDPVKFGVAKNSAVFGPFCAPGRNIAVDPGGDIYPCCVLAGAPEPLRREYRMGNVLDKKLTPGSFRAIYPEIMKACGRCAYSGARHVVPPAREQDKALKAQVSGGR